MPHFGSHSTNKLQTCDPRLIATCQDVIEWYDFTIITGYRNKDAQQVAYEGGLSKARWPASKHNRVPSIAIDVAPWPIDWNDSLAFARLAGMLQHAASRRGFELRWGGDWDRDGGSRDQTFMDLGHLEIVE